MLHLLYARFWHKVLFDLGDVSSYEPYARLFNQGYILAAAYNDARGVYVEATDVVAAPDGTFTYDGQPVAREWGKMGKSLKNAVSPDEMYEPTAPTRCGCTRWPRARSTPPARGRRATSSACTASCSGCGATSCRRGDRRRGRSSTRRPIDETQRLLHRTIDGVRTEIEALRFNTAIAKLIELNNHLTKAGRADHAARSPSRWC